MMNLDRDYIFLKFTAAAAAWTKFSTAHVDCLIDAIRARATRADGGAARAY